MKTNLLKLGFALMSGTAILSLGACSTHSQKPDAQGNPPVATASGPTDPEIAHIVVTANAIDIEAGELAKAKSKNKQIRDFASRMITDHTGVNKQAVDLANRLGVIPKDNAVSQSLKDGASANVSNLKALTGK